MTITFHVMLHYTFHCSEERHDSSLPMSPLKWHLNWGGHVKPPYFLLLLKIMLERRVNYLTGANASMCDHHGSVPDTTKVSHGSEIQRMLYQRSHGKKGDTICRLCDGEVIPCHQERWTPLITPLSPPPTTIGAYLLQPWLMKTINISNYHPKSVLNTAAIDLIDCLNYELLPIKLYKRLPCMVIDPAGFSPE